MFFLPIRGSTQTLISIKGVVFSAVSPNFDLLFNSAVNPANWSSSGLSADSMAAFTVCYWLRHASTSGTDGHLILRWAPPYVTMCDGLNLRLMVWEGIPYRLRWYSFWSGKVLLLVWEGIPSCLRWYSLWSNMIFLLVWYGIPSDLRRYSFQSETVFLPVWDGIPSGLRRYSYPSYHGSNHWIRSILNDVRELIIMRRNMQAWASSITFLPWQSVNCVDMLHFSRTGKPLLVFEKLRVRVSLFEDDAPFDIALTVPPAGDWQHCCFMWSSAGGVWMAYIDGSKLAGQTGYGAGRTIDGRCVQITQMR